MNLKKLLLVLSITVLFPFLFYKVGIGLNLLIYNLLILLGLKFTGKLVYKGKANIIIILGTLLSAIMVVINGSIIAIIINFFSLFLLAGITLLPKSRNLIYTGILSVVSFFTSQTELFTLLGDLSKKSKVANAIVKVLRILIIPIIVVSIFIFIYTEANPIFEGMLKSVFDAIESFIDWLFKNMDIALFVTIILGLLLSNYFILGRGNGEIMSLENGSSNKLVVKKDSVKDENDPKLKVEYRSAIVLFALLNILIVIINSIDIWWVWFNFSWDGEYLKQFVHEGTYLLILSILISLAISIYYFRANINFIKNNSILRNLAYLWLFQNAILTISVGVRNFWYINYFSLAYLRIGVIFFLILTLYSIYTVFLKIRDKKSTYYLFSTNSVAVYIVLVTMASFNWDVIIAKYNFSHSETAFVHYNFMSELSENALPYLDKTKVELAKIDNSQKAGFDFRVVYMTTEEYYSNIQSRKTSFMDDWPDRCLLEWNWAGQRSYNLLMINKE